MNGWIDRNKQAPPTDRTIIIWDEHYGWHPVNWYKELGKFMYESDEGLRSDVIFLFWMEEPASPYGDAP